jgi:predicted dehydrogenase
MAETARRGSTVRLGLIGAGRWGSNFVRSIQGTSDAVLARVSTERSDVSALVGPGCQLDRRWQSLIDAGDLDGVVIATPPRLHFMMAQYALSHGLPVLIEKPLTMDVIEARALCELAVDRGVPMLVDHVYLYHPAYRALQSELGTKRPLTIEGNAGNAGPFRPDVPVLWDYGPHDVAMCLDLIGESPLRVSAESLDRRSVGNAIGETIRLRLEFPSGATARLSLSNILKERSRFFSVDTGTERLVFDDAGEKKLYRQPVGPSVEPEQIPFVAALPLDVLVREFVEAIARGTPTQREADLATEVVSTLARCAATLEA